MSNLESRLEKLEARVPAEQRPWVRMTFDPKDFGGDIAKMEAEIERVSQKVWESGQNLLIARIVVPAKQAHRAG